MRKAILLTFICFVSFDATSLFAQKLDDGPAVAIDFDLVHADGLAVWSNGRLLVVTQNRTQAPVINAIDETGHSRETRAIQIPGADRVAITSVGRHVDGGIIASGFSWTAEGREATFLAIISSDGKNQQTVRLSPYSPYSLAVTADGTIWTAGIEMVNRREKDPAIHPSYSVIRSYDKNGRFVRGFIPRSTLREDVVGIPGSRLAVNGDAVAWLCEDRYYLISPAAGKVLQYPAPASSGDLVTIGLTKSGLSIMTLANDSCGVCVLENGNWSPLPLPLSLASKKGLYLYGTHGDTLAVYSRQPPDRFYAHFLPVTK